MHMMDEQGSDEHSCIPDIRNLISTYKSPGQEKWLEIFVKTEEYLQETSIKQKLSILDAVWRCASKFKVEKADFASVIAEEHVLTVTSVWCTIYLCSLRNLKLCHKVKKIFIALSEFKPCYAELEIKRKITLLLSSPMSKLVSVVETICQLIDVCELGKKCVHHLFDHFLTTVSHCLDCYCEQYFLQHTGQVGLLPVYNSDNCQSFVKVALKSFQYFPSKIGCLLSGNPAESSDHDSTIKVLETVINNLWSILFCKTLPKECTLLCGTAIGLLLGITTDLKPSICTREAIIQLLIASGASSIKVVQNPGDLVIGCFKFRLPSPEYKPITQLAIIMGIMKSQNDEMLLGAHSETVHEEAKETQTTLVEGLLFHTTYALCIESKNSPVHYMAFEAMRQWFLCMKNLFKRNLFHKDSVWLTKRDSFHASHLIDVIWDNLEDPIDGVPSLVVTLFSLLLELHKDEEAVKNSCDEQFYKSLTDKVLGLAWHVKGRYGLISSLLPYVGLQQILGKQPTLLDDMIHCLGVNQLTSPSTNAFKAFLEWERKNQQKEGQLTNKQEQSEFTKYWENTWKAALFRALTSKERLLQQNACLYWLPCALKCAPESLHCLLQDLRGAYEKELTAPNSTETARCFSAYLSVLKVSRSLALLRTEDLDEVPLRQGLTHLDDDIRSTALSVISFTPKTAEPLSEIEQKLLREFVPVNMNTACAPFRQTLFVSMKKIIGRVRDSSLILLKEQWSLISQGKTASSSPISQHALPQPLKTMFEFVTWLFDLALGCFFPGASYQRQKTAMQLLVAILEVFSANWQPDKKKGQPPASCSVLLSLANQHGHLRFFSPRCAVILCGCIESPYADIRDSGVYLLQMYFPWPLILSENDSTGRLSASVLIQKALTLARRPKVQDCESAAVLFQLIQRKYASELGWDLSFSTVEVNPVIVDRKSHGNGTLCSSVQLLQQLLVELKVHVTAAQKDMRLAAQNTPGHGISLAMAHCVEAGLCEDVECRGHLQTVVKDTVDTAVNIIHFMLDMLSGHRTTQAIGGASYADIGEALEEILCSSMINLNDVETEELQSHKDAVISCCWLNIKCACYLLAAIFEKASVQLEHMPMAAVVSEGTLKLGAETARKVIIQCRHEGVVQNCRGSFVKICQFLSQSKLPCLHTLPKSWLDDVLSSVSSAGSVTSVTRRSAGLPVVISSILSCEPTSGQRPLLQKCMQSLLNTAASPLPTVIDQHKDLPQVHAINILKILYQDTFLGSAVLQYASNGTTMAVSGFASSSWAVRNASMQLFGSLVKRLLGHHRGTDDDSEMNTISARDFFNSYLALHKFFLSHLQSTTDPSSTSPLFPQLPRPELFPILTLLSKLHPCPKADESSSNLLSCFVPHIVSLSSCPSYAVRVVAAKALLPLISSEDSLDKAKELVLRLPTPLEPFSQNFLHGTLLQIRLLLEAAKWPPGNKSGNGLVKEMLNKMWICTPSNPCPLTRAAFLGIVTSFGPSLRSHCESYFTSLHSIVMSSLQASDSQPIHLALGHAQWQHAVVRASLELQFHQSWTEGTNIREQRGMISRLLSSSDQETRLTCLQYLSKEYLQTQTSALTDSLQVDLANLLIEDVDHRCLVLALDVFVGVCVQLDMCLLSYNDLERLWKKLIQLARKMRGVTVAGKAVHACGVMLKHALNLNGNENNSSDLAAMLSEWHKLVSSYCQWDQDELLRLGTVQALKYAGITVLSYGASAVQESCFPKAAISILSSTLCLLQDEEEYIRNTAAAFVALIPETVGSVTCSAAIHLVLQHMLKHFCFIPECWVAMETIIKGQKSTQDVLEVYLRSKQMLYEQEDSNLYAEPVIVAKMAVKHLKQIVSKVLVSRVSDNCPFLNWFVTACGRLANNLQALINSGIKEYGSLQNPKPFTVRFRIMCMAEVLWFTVNNGLQTSVCLKAINTVREPLMLMLEDILQVKVHPCLTEYASELRTMVHQTDGTANRKCSDTTTS